MEEKLPRFALLEGTINDFIDEQENKNTRAKTDRDVMVRQYEQQKRPNCVATLLQNWSKSDVAGFASHTTCLATTTKKLFASCCSVLQKVERTSTV